MTTEAALFYDGPAPIQIGLLALATDDGIHGDLDRLTPHGVRLYTTRVRSYLDRNDHTARLADIAAATHTLVPHLELAAVAYACTSGNTVLGDDAIAAAVRQAHPEARVICPLESLQVAARSMQVTRLCLIAPYDVELTAALRARVESLGIDVTSSTALEVPDHLLALLRPASLTAAAAEAAAADRDADAVFIACNALRSSSCIDDLEMLTGRPVLTSTQTLLWNALSEAVQDTAPAPPLRRARPPRARRRALRRAKHPGNINNRDCS